MASLSVHSSTHQTRRAGDHRIRGFRIDEVVELSLALVVVASDPHDVFVIGSGEVGVRVDHRLPHPFGMVDVFAKDDGLGKAIGGLEEFCDLGSDQFRTRFEDQVAIKVCVVVFPVFYDFPVLVRLTQFWPPAVEVFVKADPNHLVGRQEAVGDPLPERVGVNGLAEVFDIGNVFRFLRCRSEANLGGR